MNSLISYLFTATANPQYATHDRTSCCLRISCSEFAQEELEVKRVSLNRSTHLGAFGSMGAESQGCRIPLEQEQERFLSESSHKLQDRTVKAQEPSEAWVREQFVIDRITIIKFLSWPTSRLSVDDRHNSGTDPLRVIRNIIGARYLSDLFSTLLFSSPYFLALVSLAFFPLASSLAFVCLIAGARIPYLLNLSGNPFSTRDNYVSVSNVRYIEKPQPTKPSSFTTPSLIQIDHAPIILAIMTSVNSLSPITAI